MLEDLVAAATNPVLASQGIGMFTGGKLSRTAGALTVRECLSGQGLLDRAHDHHHEPDSHEPQQTKQDQRKRQRGKQKDRDEGKQKQPQVDQEDQEAEIVVEFGKQSVEHLAYRSRGKPQDPLGSRYTGQITWRCIQ